MHQQACNVTFIVDSKCYYVTPILLFILSIKVYQAAKSRINKKRFQRGIIVIQTRGGGGRCQEDSMLTSATSPNTFKFSDNGTTSDQIATDCSESTAGVRGGGVDDVIYLTSVTPTHATPTTTTTTGAESSICKLLVSESRNSSETQNTGQQLIDDEIRQSANRPNDTVEGVAGVSVGAALVGVSVEVDNMARNGRDERQRPRGEAAAALECANVCKYNCDYGSARETRQGFTALKLQGTLNSWNNLKKTAALTPELDLINGTEVRCEYSQQQQQARQVFLETMSGKYCEEGSGAATSAGDKVSSMRIPSALALMDNRPPVIRGNGKKKRFASATSSLKMALLQDSPPTWRRVPSTYKRTTPSPRPIMENTNNLTPMSAANDKRAREKVSKVKQHQQM